MNARRSLTLVVPVLLAVLAPLLTRVRSASAQAIPRDEYLHYVPLDVPRAIRQTPSSVLFSLYGDPLDPEYRDEAPLDGMDDRRHALFQELSVRFAPFMVQNTVDAPMDFKKFRDEGPAMHLNIDSWNVMTRPNRLTDQEHVDFFPIVPVPCEGDVVTDVAMNAQQLERLRASDCRVLKLLEQYDPYRPTTAPLRTESIETYDDWFQVLWLDYPGRSPREWKEIYENPVNETLREKWRGILKIYSHPYVREVVGPSGAEGYEFILQYWFFYPTNDGGNNHVGDWEHINIVISPMDRVTRHLTAEEIEALIDGEWLDANDDRKLVIKRVDYYFHSKVMQLDFSRPNVYQSQAEWEAEVDRLPKRRHGIDHIWGYIRRMAYQDEAQTTVNTHPVAYIGADNKGIDQILAAPGGTNRDSHGTFPGPALYKDVGPGGATENIPSYFKHWEWYTATPEGRTAMETFSRGGVLYFGRSDRVEVIPDWERVYELAKLDVGVRAEWSWLYLPIRFGYPAIKSPFAGIIAHAETGNLSIIGPAFNNGWNRSGTTAQFSLYDPNRFPRIYQLGWQDGFINDWGFFNLTLPSLIMIPPFDFIWKFLGLPIRLAAQSDYPALFPSDKLPFRAMGIQSGVSWMTVTDGYVDLFIQDPQFTEILVDLILFLRDNGISEGEGVVEGTEDIIETAFGPYFEINFFMGAKFASQNRFRFSKSDIGFDVKVLGIDEPFRVASDLNFNEWTGFLRFGLLTGAIQPYIKPGYGISWYRLENITTEGTPIETPTLDWITKFTWSFGVGFEWHIIRSTAALLKGLDVSLIGEYVRAWNGLGLDPSNLPLESLVLLGVTADELPRDRTVGRNMFFVGLNIGI